MYLVGLTGGIATGKSMVSRIFSDSGIPLLSLVNRHIGSYGSTSATNTLMLKPARHVVNSITHPEIRKAILFRVLQHFFRGENYVVLDLPPEDLQIQRLCERDGIDEEAARARIQAQYPMAVKRRQATHIVNNGGTVQETRAQVHALIEELNKSRLHLLGGTSDEDCEGDVQGGRTACLSAISAMLLHFRPNICATTFKIVHFN
ncbi:unnamed protein product [Gongylonema pulchrum]|uniref:Dephospho-CoA kinase n=1 Tax=Gongylonema pulchrum TaxID=637853 RepID=A0A183DPL3_9BILA|nr:unnamed protein product [Gongylonema pulchrum]